MKLIIRREHWLESLIDAVVALVCHLLGWASRLNTYAKVLIQHGMVWAREVPKECYIAAAAVGPAMYVSLGLLRCFATVMGEKATTYYIPAIDWWWVGLIKLFQ